MARLIPCGRDRALLLPLVVVAAVGRMPAGAVAVRPIPGGGAQDRPRRPLALPISRRDSGIFSPRRIGADARHALQPRGRGEAAAHSSLPCPASGWREPACAIALLVACGGSL